MNTPRAPLDKSAHGSYYTCGMQKTPYEICRADCGDIDQLLALLEQVNRIHAKLRPDLFRDGGKKYTREALETLLRDETRPVFAAKRDGALLGYAFCVFQTHCGSNETPHATLYLDDLCVREGERGKGVGQALYRRVCAYAKQCGCYNVTLNVWAGNDAAIGFYRALGMCIQKYGMETIL